MCPLLKGDPATAQAKIIMLTAMAQEADIQKGTEAGCNGHFTTPFSPMHLLQKIDAVLEGLLER